MKLIEKLLEIEEGNNASALKKFYDFLNNNVINKDF